MWGGEDEVRGVEQCGVGMGSFSDTSSAAPPIRRAGNARPGATRWAFDLVSAHLAERTRGEFDRPCRTGLPA
ncbi:hypothetical protein MDOR_13960 [Mycolicibacterium doricum]|uniref:Uncharacterized protein n=1 Tax=Mycolicibacterium doricum TaxID=126673 RepID=A0A7I7VQP9_9MYCO|nr:hypothetical protein MDOR_13960 [Mycolicibacterium doricum]